MLDNFCKRGKVSFIVGGQWGSEGKGAAAAFTALHCGNFDIATTNAGAQAGHTSTHGGVTKVVFHLPTYSLYQPCFTYLNAGSVIDPEGLLRELEQNPQILRQGFAIHPNAAIITPDCKEAEGRDDSAQTKIASTRKGVGEALSRKVLRSGQIADYWNQRAHKDMPPWARKLGDLVARIDLNDEMRQGKSVLAEVPQGHSLSIDSPFYPHTTSRNCTVAQAMSDAGIHPSFYHRSMMVIRTFPIRVGHIDTRDQPKSVLDFDSDIGDVEAKSKMSGRIGNSGPCFPDQHEISWDDLGVKAEITTVTKRVRRVFTFSEQQVREAIVQTRPAVVFLSFCDYLPNRELAKVAVDKVRRICNKFGSICNDGPEILTAWGPTTADVIRAEEL